MRSTLSSLSSHCKTPVAVGGGENLLGKGFPYLSKTLEYDRPTLSTISETRVRFFAEGQGSMPAPEGACSGLFRNRSCLRERIEAIRTGAEGIPAGRGKGVWKLLFAAVVTALVLASNFGGNSDRSRESVDVPALKAAKVDR
jgi:hypothetical protein